MRLVDADEIRKMFDPETWQGEMMIAIADTLPTAYDIEAVVDVAKEVAAELCALGFCDHNCNCELCKVGKLIDRIVEAIRKGGVKNE